MEGGVEGRVQWGRKERKWQEKVKAEVTAEEN